jgi:hypothetical protein
VVAGLKHTIQNPGTFFVLDVAGRVSNGFTTAPIVGVTAYIASQFSASELVIHWIEPYRAVVSMFSFVNLVFRS